VSQRTRRGPGGAIRGLISGAAACKIKDDVVVAAWKVVTREDDFMATAEESQPVPAEDLAELEKTIQNLITGVRDPDAMDRAAQEMDEGRDEIQRRLGVVDLAVALVRESRDE
jgi:hypothetical protein